MAQVDASGTAASRRREQVLFNVEFEGIGAEVRECRRSDEVGENDMYKQIRC